MEYLNTFFTPSKDNLSELIEGINNAFFRIESFMNGKVNDYLHFGFNDAFTKLFFEIRKPENYTYANCKLIGKYYELTSQISFNYDKSDFENDNAYENEIFCKDCEEIMYLNWERVEEFCQFSTPDEIAEYERKFSITDIVKYSATPTTKDGVEVVKDRRKNTVAEKYNAKVKAEFLKTLDGSVTKEKYQNDGERFEAYAQELEIKYSLVVSAGTLKNNWNKELSDLEKKKVRELLKLFGFKELALKLATPR